MILLGVVRMSHRTFYQFVHSQSNPKVSLDTQIITPNPSWSLLKKQVWSHRGPCGGCVVHGSAVTSLLLPCGTQLTHLFPAATEVEDILIPWFATISMRSLRAECTY